MRICNPWISVQRTITDNNVHLEQENSRYNQEHIQVRKLTYKNIVVVMMVLNVYATISTDMLHIL